MQTQNEIVTRALRACGVVPQDKSPRPKQMQEAEQALYSFLASLSNYGLRGFTNIQQSIAVTSGTQDYGTAYLSVFMYGAFVRDSSSSDAPVVFISPAQYDTIADKTETGKPQYAVVYRNPADFYQIRLHPIPDASYTLYFRSVEDITQPTDPEAALSIPQRWEDVIIYGLASNLADEYQIPDNLYSRISSKFQALLELARGRDHEVQDWVSIEPI